MNILLPLVLIGIANLVLYWIFFGKARFEKKLEQEILVAKAAGKEINDKDHQEIMQLTGKNVACVFGSQNQCFSKDQLIVVKESKSPKKKRSKK